jgi:hypothetical protein
MCPPAAGFAVAIDTRVERSEPAKNLARSDGNERSRGATHPTVELPERDCLGHVLDTNLIAGRQISDRACHAQHAMERASGQGEPLHRCAKQFEGCCVRSYPFENGRAFETMVRTVLAANLDIARIRDAPGHDR